MSQKGIALIPILIILALIGTIIFAVFKSQTSEVEAPPEQIVASPSSNPSLSPSPTSSSSTKPSTKTPVPSASPKITCNTSTDICFESDNLDLTLYEGNMEDKDKWITDKLYVVGQTEGGFEVSMQGFPGEFTIYTPDKAFPNNKKSTVYLRAYKNTAKKGIYEGKVMVKSIKSNKTTTANLKLTYTDWNNSLIHVTPTDFSLDCSVKEMQGGSTYIDCPGSNDIYIVLYYFGEQKGISAKTVPDSGSNRWIELFSGSYVNPAKFDMKDTQRFYPGLMGFPNGQIGAHNEPSGSYSGNIIFSDSGGKEIAKVHYNFHISALVK